MDMVKQTKVEKDGVNIDRMRWILNWHKYNLFTNNDTENYYYF